MRIMTRTFIFAILINVFINVSSRADQPDFSLRHASSPDSLNPRLLESDLNGIRFGGWMEFSFFSKDHLSDQDIDKSLTFQLEKLRADVLGYSSSGFGYFLQIRFDTLGFDDAFLKYDFNPWISVRAGSLRKPFSKTNQNYLSQVQLASRGEIYHDFLHRMTGYTGRDLGLILNYSASWPGLSFHNELSLGIFNGKENDSREGYANQQLEKIDPGLFSKDFAAQYALTLFRNFQSHFAISIKSAEDRSRPENYETFFHESYLAGIGWHNQRYGIFTEAALGDNHQAYGEFPGFDTNIIQNNSANMFFSLFLEAWIGHNYKNGASSRIIYRGEALDPSSDRDNDGKILHTAGMGYTFPSWDKFLFTYSLLQPITGISGEERFRHQFKIMWRKFL